ncbi:hypothetical protein C8046_08585 [Serinibacter arcticus]|uniref:Secreted protein n=1 Tax=Serinibacter arcticus TaxID=1655435 RepID=A0A2U1ZUR3_9MICO|nr:hypothetical protein [Serinibacter arcticus]PWD50701.1 hypothetical protein C8046_08585 [Serinibacter arcticus]
MTTTPAGHTGQGLRRTALAALAVGALTLTACGPAGSGVGEGSSPAVTPSGSTSPSTPATTPTSEPTEPATGSASPTPASPPAPVGSEIAYPVCGESFDLPTRPPQLRLDLVDEIVEHGDDGGGELPGQLSATVSLANDGDSPVAGLVDFDVFLVVVDGDGRVVSSAAHPFSPGPESSHHLAVGPGLSVERTASGLTGTHCTDETYEGVVRLDPGSYEAFALMNVYQDGAVEQQAQGGPWPLEVTAEAPPARDWSTWEEPPPLDGAVPLGSGCGVALDGQPSTGLALEAGPIRTPRAVDDSIDELALTLTSEPALTGANVLPTVLLSRDGVLVTHVPATDNTSVVTMSAGSTLGLTSWTSLLDCESQPVPPGTYTAHPVLVGLGGDGFTIVARAADQQIVVR